MTYHYLQIYHDFGKPDEWVKNTLLSDFNQEKAIISCKKVLIEFKDYSFQEYPDQNELKAYLRRLYLNKKEKCYYWFGTAYYSYETLYEALSKQKRLMALEVEIIE